MSTSGKDSKETTQIPFEYLVWAAGAAHPSPTSLTDSGGKEAAIAELARWQLSIAHASSVVIVGGGGSGVELAAEIAEHYAEHVRSGTKTITLVHSRKTYFDEYGTGLHQAVAGILTRAGVRQVLGQRVVVPQSGFPRHVNTGQLVKTNGGMEITADLVIMCTGLSPNSAPLSQLSPTAINPRTGFVSVLPTMQLADPMYPHVFAIGDAADTTDPKTAKSAGVHAKAVVDNISAMISTSMSMAAGDARAVTRTLSKAAKGPRRINLTMGHLGGAVAFQVPYLGWHLALDIWFVKWARAILSRWLKGPSRRPDNVGADKTWRRLNAAGGRGARVPRPRNPDL